MKRYPSAVKLAAAWQEDIIEGEAFAAVPNSSGYRIIADADTIWNGHKSQVLVRRNRRLGLVLALRESSVSLGKVALKTIGRAIAIPARLGMKRLGAGIFENTQTPRRIPCPCVKLDSLAEPALAACDIGSLRPLVLESSARELRRLMGRFKQPPKGGFAELERAWQEEEQMLRNAGLSAPEELVGEYSALKVTRRLLGS